MSSQHRLHISELSFSDLEIKLLFFNNSYSMTMQGLMTPMTPSSDGVTIKILYGVDVLHRPASHPIFSYWVG